MGGTREAEGPLIELMDEESEDAAIETWTDGKSVFVSVHMSDFTVRVRLSAEAANTFGEHCIKVAARVAAGLCAREPQI